MVQRLSAPVQTKGTGNSVSPPPSFLLGGRRGRWGGGQSILLNSQAHVSMAAECGINSRVLEPVLTVTDNSAVS